MLPLVLNHSANRRNRKARRRRRKRKGRNSPAPQNDRSEAIFSPPRVQRRTFMTNTLDLDSRRPFSHCSSSRWLTTKSFLFRKRYAVVDELKRVIAGKKVVKLTRVLEHTPSKEFKEAKADSKKPEDWVLFCVLASKGTTKKTSNDNPYMTWRLSDLAGFTLPMNLFGDAHQFHYKQEPGTVLAILNPTVSVTVRTLLRCL